MADQLWFMTRIREEKEEDCTDHIKNSLAVHNSEQCKTLANQVTTVTDAARQSRSRQHTLHTINVFFEQSRHDKTLATRLTQMRSVVGVNAMLVYTKRLKLTCCKRTIATFVLRLSVFQQMRLYSTTHPRLYLLTL